MAKPQSQPPVKSRPGAKIQPIPKSRWQGPLVAGLCFGLGYGITQRLLSLQLPTFVHLGQGFELREFPGTGLQSLRLKFGTEAQPIRGDLELQQLDQQTQAPEPSGEPAKDALGEAETSPQSGPKSANLDAVEAQAPPVPQLPPPTVACFWAWNQRFTTNCNPTDIFCSSPRNNGATLPTPLLRQTELGACASTKRTEDNVYS